MGLLKGKSEGGAGGKRGHSNMNHRGTTDEIKAASRKRRRLDAKEIIGNERIIETPGTVECGNCGASWADCEISLELRAEVSHLVRSGARIQAMDRLRRVGLSLPAAKAVCIHIAGQDSQCHRCGKPIDHAENVECRSCHAFNYNW